jgi:hypothetical protein
MKERGRKREGRGGRGLVLPHPLGFGRPCCHQLISFNKSHFAGITRPSGQLINCDGNNNYEQKVIELNESVQ